MCDLSEALAPFVGVRQTPSTCLVPLKAAAWTLTFFPSPPPLHRQPCRWRSRPLGAPSQLNVEVGGGRWRGGGSGGDKDVLDVQRLGFKVLLGKCDNAACVRWEAGRKSQQKKRGNQITSDSSCDFIQMAGRQLPTYLSLTNFFILTG